MLGRTREEERGPSSPRCSPGHIGSTCGGGRIHGGRGRQRCRLDRPYTPGEGRLRASGIGWRREGRQDERAEAWWTLEVTLRSSSLSSLRRPNKQLKQDRIDQQSNRDMNKAADMPEAIHCRDMKLRPLGQIREGDTPLAKRPADPSPCLSTRIAKEERIELIWPVNKYIRRLFLEPNV